MTIYAIGGVSGTGKTHFRLSHNLCSLRTVDIADVYERSVADGHANLHWRKALARFVRIVQQLLEEDTESDIVLEAFFKPGGAQRQAITALAKRFGVEVRWGWAFQSRTECYSRVHDAPRGADSDERVKSRLEFIRVADSHFFRERKGENLGDLILPVQEQSRPSR